MYGYCVVFISNMGLTHIKLMLVKNMAIRAVQKLCYILKNVTGLLNGFIRHPGLGMVSLFRIPDVVRWLVPRRANIFVFMPIFGLYTQDDASMGVCILLGVHADSWKFC